MSKSFQTLSFALALSMGGFSLLSCAETPLSATPQVESPQVETPQAAPLAASPEVEKQQSPFLEKAKSFINDLVNLANLSKSTNGSVSSDSNAQVKSLSERIDFNLLAKSSLGASRWRTYSAKDRLSFMTTLQELLEVVVYPKAKNISAQVASLQYDFFKEKNGKEKNDAIRVAGKVEREKNGELIQESLDIVLFFDSKNERIVDALIADERVSANLKRQFDEALKKKSFKEIIAKMKKRVADSNLSAQTDEKNPVNNKNAI